MKEIKVIILLILLVKLLVTVSDMLRILVIGGITSLILLVTAADILRVSDKSEEAKVKHQLFAVPF